jgi:hypothetical protein
MNKKILFISFCLFSLTSIYTRNTAQEQTFKFDIPKDWILYNIGDVGQIGIPSILELRSKNSVHTLNQKAIKNYFVTHKKIEVSSLSNYQLIFQPLGYDSGKIPSTYVRVLIHYHKGKLGDFMKWNDASNLTSSEREELYIEYKKDLVDFISKGKDEMKVRLIKINPIEVGKTNGLDYIKHSYTRQMGDRPIVKVQTYSFYNSDEMVEITISYGLAENETENLYLEKIVSTFNFTTRK